MGKKSNPPPPDYAPLANASEETAKIMASLGREQLDFAKQQYREVSPFLADIAEGQRQAQDQQLGQARDYYDYQRDAFRPVERGLVASAQSFNTEAERERRAREAAVDSGLAFGTTRRANERALASMGVNPNSGRFAGIGSAAGLTQAASRAAAVTNARAQADQVGYARRLDAAGLGRGLPGASTAAYASATRSGALAGDARQSAGQNYSANFAAGAGTIGAGQNARLQGLGNVLNAQTSAYINSNDSFLGDVGGILGGAAGLAKAGGFAALSDRRRKENIREVGVDQRTALSLYEFNYIGEPDRKFIGVMADEVELIYPDAVSYGPDGYQVVDYGALGIEMKEVT